MDDYFSNGITNGSRLKKRFGSKLWAKKKLKKARSKLGATEDVKKQ